IPEGNKDESRLNPKSSYVAKKLDCRLDCEAWKPGNWISFILELVTPLSRDNNELDNPPSSVWNPTNGRILQLTSNFSSTELTIGFDFHTTSYSKTKKIIIDNLLRAI
ncbi:tRNA (guanine-N(7)-)-methyltransferase, partial [Striga asiatica]